MAHPLSRLKLDYPLWIITWSEDQSTITARHLVSEQVLTAKSPVELRALLEHPPQEDARD